MDMDMDMDRAYPMCFRTQFYGPHMGHRGTEYFVKPEIWGQIPNRYFNKVQQIGRLLR